MDFSIHHRVDARDGWELGRKGTRAYNTICRNGRLPSSSYQSEIHRSSICKLSEVDKEMCYSLLTSEKIPELEAAWQVKVSVSSEELFGPASLLANRVIVYPCVKFKCKVWCCCLICRTKHMKKEAANENFSQEKDHQIYHKAWHVDCKLCNGIFNIIPMYKFLMWENDRYGGGFYQDLGIFKHWDSTTKRKSCKGERFHCKECDSFFSRSRDLVRHCLSIHTGQSYSCEQCYVSFNRIDELNGHIEDVHEYSTKCDDCQVEFMNLRTLRRHKAARYNDKRELKYCCEKCNIKACSQRILNRHMKSHEHTCEDCGSIFSRSSSLVTHRNNTKLNCEDCGLKFCTRKSMIVHKTKEHSSILRCCYCEETFSTKYNMKRHIDRKHPDLV